MKSLLASAQAFDFCDVGFRLLFAQQKEGRKDNHKVQQEGRKDGKGERFL